MTAPPFNVDAHIKLWEKAVDVQQHFNDISWRIRALGLTVLTFTFGAVGVAYSGAEPIEVLGRLVNPAFLVPGIGFFLWVAFWFTDAGWYHKLLVGAVKDAMRIEKLLRANGVDASLGTAIGDESPIRFYRRQSAADRIAHLPRVPRQFRGAEAKLHSKHKLHLFYGSIAALLLVTGVVLFAQTAHPSAPVPDPTINIFNELPTPAPTQPTTPPSTPSPSPTP